VLYRHFPGLEHPFEVYLIVAQRAEAAKHLTSTASLNQDGEHTMRPETGKRPRSISATARLTEARRILRNLHDSRFNDEVIAHWLGTAPENIARWRTGRAAPTPAILASLRRLVRSARHV
jgi:DNA-binding transcriptional regulator YiaG